MAAHHLQGTTDNRLKHNPSLSVNKTYLLSLKLTFSEWPAAGVAERSYPTTEVRDSGLEELTYIQEAVAMQGTGGPRGATPRLRSGGAAVGRYPSSKLKSNGCAFLEQL